MSIADAVAYAYNLPCYAAEIKEEPLEADSGAVKDEVKDEKIPKHLRHRYWNSWEEMRLMELWRRYFPEVTTLQKNGPVFRKIAEGMKERGFFLNGQECRRKMSSLKNKYIAEQRKLQLANELATSEWRLYPLIDCLLAPKVKNFDPTHELKLVNHLLTKLPPPPQETTLPQALPAAPTTTIIKEENGFATQCSILTVPTPQPTKRRYVPRHRYSNTSNTNTNTNGVSYVLQHHFTMPRLQQLRAENIKLIEHRDLALQRLRSEEQELQCLENFLGEWQRQQEHVLQRLQCAGK